MFVVTLKPMSRAAPAMVKMLAGYKALSCNEVYVVNNKAINTPIPTPINKRAIFKRIIRPNRVPRWRPLMKIDASAPFSISAKRSLFLVDRKR